MFASTKESNKSRFDSYSVRNSDFVLIISHITFWDLRVHSFSDNLSRSSCKVGEKLLWSEKLPLSGMKSPWHRYTGTQGKFKLILLFKRILFFVEAHKSNSSPEKQPQFYTFTVNRFDSDLIRTFFCWDKRRRGVYSHQSMD